MTTYTPTPEAVEAAARAAGMYGRVAQDGLTPEQQFERDWQDEEYRDRALGRARAALTAAGPIIAAEVRRAPDGCAWCCASNPPGVKPGSGHDICPAQRGRIARGEGS